MARLVYLLQGYFHASSDGASSCSSSASSSLWTWDTEKALYPKGLKQTLRAEHRRTPRGSSGRLRRSDLRDYKFAFVITNSSYCKSLAQENNVVSTIPRVFPPPPCGMSPHSLRHIHQEVKFKWLFETRSSQKKPSSFLYTSLWWSRYLGFPSH